MRRRRRRCLRRGVFVASSVCVCVQTYAYV